MKKKEAKGVWKALSLGLSLLLAVSAAGTDAVLHGRTQLPDIWEPRQEV